MPDPSQASTSSSAPPLRTLRSALNRGSPPPYSPEPPAIDASSPFLTKRAASSPHLHSPPQSPHIPHIYPQSHASSRRPSASGLHSQTRSQLRSRIVQPQVRSETEDDDADMCLSGDDAVVYKARQRGRLREQEQDSGYTRMLRERLFGKGKSRADAADRVRFITTAPGMAGAGETETESDDAVSPSLHIASTRQRNPLAFSICCPCNADSALTPTKFNHDPHSSSFPHFVAARSTYCAFHNSLLALNAHYVSARRVNVDTYSIDEHIQQAASLTGPWTSTF